MKISKLVSVSIVACLCLSVLPLCGCKSEEQIAAGVQSAAAIRDVVYNEAPEVVKSTIVINGSGEVRTVPDSASITFIVKAKDKDAVKAQAQNEEIVKALLEVLKTDGVADKDVKTANISLYEQYDYSRSEPMLTGYEASNNVEVTIREVENISVIIADALAAGVSSYDSLTFSATDTEGAYDQALTAAVSDAARKAAVIAEAAGLTLTGTMTIAEQSFSQPESYARNLEMTVAEDKLSAGTLGPSISTGEILTKAELVVTYEVQPAK